MKVSTSTVAALFAKMALADQRIAMVDMALLVFQHFHIYRRGGWSQSSTVKNFFVALWVVAAVDVFQFPENGSCKLSSQLPLGDHKSYAP